MALNAYLTSVDVDDAEQNAADLFEILTYVFDCLDPEATLDDDSIRAMTDMIKDRVIEYRNKKIDRRARIQAMLDKAAALKASKLTQPSG